MSRQSGITLVALIITIIVLLILAGVSLSSVIGENGILTRAENAVIKSEIAQEKEQIELAKTAVTMKKISNNDYTAISKSELQEQLDSDIGSGKASVGQKGANILVVTYDTGRSYDVEVEGRGPIDFESIIENAVAHEDQDPLNPDIGIGTDGNPVDLDNWRYFEVDGEIHLGQIGLGGYTSGPSTYVGYIGEINTNGEIIGKMPQYIKIDGVAYPVVYLDITFRDMENLKKAPEIPSTVKYMRHTFKNCTNLADVPTIPDSVESMYYAFDGCESLVTIKNFPKNLTNMQFTFYGCTSLTSVPVIPDIVENMNYAFYGCESLVTINNLPKNLTNMYFAFYGCTSLTTVPTIPENVENMYGTFSGCTSLKGTITINANPTSYTRCFYNVTTMGTELTLTGSSSLLTELAATVQ